jgi:hypothetical protein
MPINDPFARTGQMFRDLGGAYRARHERDRQAPLDAANLRAKDQAYEVGQIKLDETRRKLGAASDFRDFAAGQAPGMAPLDRATGQSDFLMGQGNIKGAAEVFNVPKGLEDVTSKMTATQKTQSDAILNTINENGIEAGVALAQRMPGIKEEQIQSLRNMEMKPGGVLEQKLSNGAIVYNQFIPGKGWVRGVQSPKGAGAGAGATAGPHKDGTYPFLAKLMAEGWSSTQRLTGPLKDSLEAAMIYADENGMPFGPAEAFAFERNAMTNRGKGRTASSRLVLGKAWNVEQAGKLLTDMKKTIGKIDFSDVALAGRIEKVIRHELNDPLLSEYIAQRGDSIFILTNAMKQNGVTDKAIEIEMETLPPATSPRAFAAWFNTQARAINSQASYLNRDLGFNLPQLDVFEAGQAGAPTKEQPVPGPQKDIAKRSAHIIRTQKDFDAFMENPNIPSGTAFEDPNGTERFKP